MLGNRLALRLAEKLAPDRIRRVDRSRSAHEMLAALGGAAARKVWHKVTSTLQGLQLSRYFTENIGRKKNLKKLVDEVGLQESGSER